MGRKLALRRAAGRWGARGECSQPNTALQPALRSQRDKDDRSAQPAATKMATQATWIAPLERVCGCLRFFIRLRWYVVVAPAPMAMNAEMKTCERARSAVPVVGAHQGEAECS